MTPDDPWDDGDGGSDLDALPDYAPAASEDYDEPTDWGDEFAPAEVPDGDDVQIPVVQVVNPPGTIAVTAHMNGAVAQVDLDPSVTRLTEAQLEDEIRAMADVA